MSAGAISARVERIRAGADPQLLAEMPSGYAILGKYQPSPVRGCCMLLPREVVSSPNDLEPAAREGLIVNDQCSEHRLPRRVC